MLNILITGATGNIGCWLVSHLLRKGYHIIAHGSSMESINGLRERININSENNIKFWVQDFLKNEFDFPDLSKVDIIIHCAAATKVREGTLNNYDHYFALNVCALKIIAKKAVEENIRHFIHLSTGQVYGISSAYPIHENSEKNPINLYGFTKLMGEILIRSLGIMGLNYTIFRPFSVYGKGHVNIISIIKNRICNNEKLIIYGDGTQKRAFTHVKDLCNAIEMIIDNNQCFSQEYNFSGLKEYSINELVEMISKKFNKLPSIEYKQATVKELTRNIADTRKIQDLGFKFKETLEHFIDNELN